MRRPTLRHEKGFFGVLSMHAQGQTPDEETPRSTKKQEEDPKARAPPPSQDLARTPLCNHLHHE
jgi:hypothetical protein